MRWRRSRGIFAVLAVASIVIVLWLHRRGDRAEVCGCACAAGGSWRWFSPRHGRQPDGGTPFSRLRQLSCAEGISVAHPDAPSRPARALFAYPADPRSVLLDRRSPGTACSSIFIPVYMFLFLPLPLLIVGETRGFLRAIGSLHWGLMTTVFAISHGAFLACPPDEAIPAAGGAGPPPLRPHPHPR